VVPGRAGELGALPGRVERTLTPAIYQGERGKALGEHIGSPLPWDGGPRGRGDRPVAPTHDEPWRIDPENIPSPHAGRV